ncbi:hypothetical protein G9A89_009887 [Geosiphon pyriformis]|nr:hypothetical protein G9A89_009887 [Geosiphon pyriformis]
MGKCHSKQTLSKQDDTYEKPQKHQNPYSYPEPQTKPPKTHNSHVLHFPKLHRLAKRSSKSSFSLKDNSKSFPQQKNQSQETITVNTNMSIQSEQKFNFHENYIYTSPTKEQEIERLNTQHEVLKHVWNGNYSSPTETMLKMGGIEVLEVCCGAGDWTREMAKTYPFAHFNAIDVASPVFPSKDLVNLPANVRFQDANLKKSVDFLENTFDFVYFKLLEPKDRGNNWEEIIIKDLVRVTKPGGWIEVMSLNQTLESQGPITMCIEEFRKSLTHSQDLKTSVSSEISNYLKSTQKVLDVYPQERQLPLGKHGGRFSELALQNYIQSLRQMKLKLAPLMNISSDQFDEMISTITEEMEIYKTYTKTFRFFAKKSGGPASRAPSRTPSRLPSRRSSFSHNKFGSSSTGSRSPSPGPSKPPLGPINVINEKSSTNVEPDSRYNSSPIVSSTNTKLPLIPIEPTVKFQRRQLSQSSISSNPGHRTSNFYSMLTPGYSSIHLNPLQPQMWLSKMPNLKNKTIEPSSLSESRLECEKIEMESLD